MGWPAAWDGYDENEAELMRIGDETAATQWCEARYGADGNRYFDSIGEFASADLALLTDNTTATALMTGVIEAFRQGVGGFAQDITVQGQPWSFDPGAVLAPVQVMHGEADTLVPVAHSRHTAEIIPGAQLTTLSDHGHVSLFTEIPPLAADLVAPLR
jgi:pimeloyl-ACP methyl ester carboxylesterase